MKNRLLKTGIGSLIFIFLIAFAFSMIHPVYSKVTSFVAASIDQSRELLETATGYTFSYDSLSPSILSTINIKGIEVFDTHSNKKIVTVKKLVLSYSLYKILHGNFSDCLNGLTLNGIVIEYDGLPPKVIQTKISESTDKTVAFNVAALSPVLSLIIDYLPVYIHLKNVSVHVTYTDVDAFVVLRRFSITTNSSDRLSVVMNGHAKIKKGYSTITGNINSSAVITNTMDDSSIRLYLTSISTELFNMQRLNLLVTYSNDIILIKTLNNLFPLFASAKISLPEKKVIASIKTQNVYPTQILQVRKPSAFVKKILRTRFSVSVDGSYDLNSGKLSYTSAGNIALPDSLIKGEVAIDYDVNGNSEQVTIQSVDVSGKDYDTSFTGVYNIIKKQPSGTANIRRITLKNGNVFSGDVYIDALEQGFVCFAPQIFFNEHNFTALQLSIIPLNESIDFDFEAYDYSHLAKDDFEEISDPGFLHVAGSYLLDTRYLQTSVSFTNFFIDSIVTAASFPLQKEKIDSLSKVAHLAEPFVFSGDVYIASDLKSISYNVPYSVIANTKKDGQVLAFSLDGTDTSFQISRFDLVYGKLSVAMTAMAEVLPETHELFFTNDVTINAIPYKFTGSVSDKWLDISGDYGFRFAASYAPEYRGSDIPFVSGTVHVDELPVSLAQYTFALSTDISFSDTTANGLSCSVSRFSVQEPSGKLSNSPRLDLTGEITKYGALLTSFVYTDTVSALNGSGDCLWNFNDSLFDSANISFSVSSLISEETWSFEGTVMNPSKATFSQAAIKDDFYISAEAAVKHFPSARLLKAQRAEDTINATINMSGTLGNPYVSLSLDHSSMSILGAPLQCSGSGVLEDGVLQVTDTAIQWVMLDISNLSAEYQLASSSGSASAAVHAAFLKQTVDMPLKLNFDAMTNDKKGVLPKSYIVTLASEGITSSFLENPVSANFSVIRTDNRFDMYSSGDMSVNGYALDTGEVYLEMGEGFPVKAVASGFINNSGVIIQVNEIAAELADFSQFISLPFFSVYRGHVRGAISIVGKLTDPDISGSMKILDPDFNLPIIIPDHFITQEMALEIKDNEVVMPQTLFNVKDVPVYARLGISLDRWNFLGLDIFVHTDRSVYVPADVDLGDVHITGEGAPDLLISIMADHAEVSGHIFAKNTTVDISPKAIAAAASAGAALENGGNFSIQTSSTNFYYPLLVSLDISMEQKVQVLIDPILRGVAAPNTELSMMFDSSENKLLLNSDITFRGGEIVYLNRNFYMKEGRIVFSDKQDTLDPYLTVRAETRERDVDGNQVTVVLSAENALLSQFTPHFSAVPAKSEIEIMELLGQIVSADSSSSAGLLLAGGDYAVQVTVMRKIENALRDLGNFDIFSIRTMVLQNAMKRSLSMNSENGSTNSLTVGNFFDNSTVYIGKYFTSELYTDALMHWTYDETRVDDNDTAGGLVFQPEFGVELSSPFVNIRWSISPDLDSIKNNLWIPTTAVTLSWKFTF